MINDKELERKISHLLNKKEFIPIYNLLKDKENDAYVTENVMDLISLICETVKVQSLLENALDVESCKQILLLLVDKGDPKVVLISLLEHADSFKDHEFFCLLLDPLKTTLEKSPSKRGKTLRWVLQTLYAHIKTLELPEELDLEDEEVLLLDCNAEYQDACYVVSHYCHFLNFFVAEVSFETLKNKEVHYFNRVYHQQELLHRYILKAFHHPLVYHDLHLLASGTRSKSTMRVVTEAFVESLSKICRNVLSLFKYDSVSKIKDENETRDELDEDDDVHPLALANLSYLIFAEHVAVDFQPFVHSHLYIFMKNLKYILLLLQEGKNLVLYKGLCLAETLLNNLDDLEIDYDCIELEIFTNFTKLLLRTAIHCAFEGRRKSAIKSFCLYMIKCNYKGRYHLIMQVLSSSEMQHSGAQALVIGMYKDCFHSALHGITEAKYFLGANFGPFARKVFVLDEGVEADLVENKDRIVATLNFIRYMLLLQSSAEHLSEIWDFKGFISENFVEPLRMAIHMSRAHYNQALYETREEKKKGKDEVNLSVYEQGRILPNVPVDMKKDVIENALMTFDLIECLVCRVKEIMGE